MTTPTKQDSYLGRLQQQLSAERLGPYLQAEAGNLRLALARYYWNVELCRAYYPVLQALEIALRNNLDRALGPIFPVRNFEHVHSWIDRLPRVVVHPGGEAGIARAKSTLPSWDEATRTYLVRTPSHGDLVAAMSFGFWSGLLEAVYDQPGTKGIWFWPTHSKTVFPGAGAESMSSLRVVFNRLRHFRNRVFHHEPLWPKRNSDPSPKERYDDVLQALRWLGGEQSQIASRLHGGTEVFDEQTQVRLTEIRLMGAIDEVLEQARLKKEAKDAKKAAREAEKELRAAKRKEVLEQETSRNEDA